MGLYNYDGITIYEKWLADHRDEQQSNGVLPSIIPSSGWGYAWGVAQIGRVVWSYHGISTFFMEIRSFGRLL